MLVHPGLEAVVLKPCVHSRHSRGVLFGIRKEDVAGTHSALTISAIRVGVSMSLAFHQIRNPASAGRGCDGWGKRQIEQWVPLHLEQVGRNPLKSYLRHEKRCQAANQPPDGAIPKL